MIFFSSEKKQHLRGAVPVIQVINLDETTIKIEKLIENLLSIYLFILGNDSSSSSSSFPCEIVVQPFKRDFRFSFDYSTTSSSDTFYKTHRRGSSLPSALLKFSPESRSRGSSFIRHSVSRSDSLKSHHLTPVTLDYLKAHSALVATLVSLVCPDELDDIQNDFDDNYFASMEDLTGGSPSDVSNFSLVDVRSYR